MNTAADWFLSNTVIMEDTPLGREYAIEMMRQFRKNFPHEERIVVMGLLASWNKKSDKPFPLVFLDFLLNVPAAKPKKRSSKPGPEKFATNLFEDVK